MKHISILVPENAVLAAIDDPRHVLAAVNEHAAVLGEPDVFEIKFVGLKKEVRLHNSAFSVHSDYLIDEVEETDLVFIPAFYGDKREFLAANAPFISWIRNQYERGAEVVSLCVGAFMLAETGLLDGRKCSTHWRAADEFRRMFPRVDLQTDKIITEEQGIYTSGGATSYWYLLLYLVEKFTNRETAILISKIFAIDIKRDSQSQFIMFKGQRDHTDDDVKKAQKIIENDFHERLTIEDLADRCALSRRSLERRFRRATNNTISEYIQRVKIEAAKKSLETSRKNITEVMLDVGYTDTKAFRAIFKKITGMTPIDYRNRYNKEVH